MPMRVEIRRHTEKNPWTYSQLDSYQRELAGENEQRNSCQQTETRNPVDLVNVKSLSKEKEDEETKKKKGFFSKIF